MRNKYLQCIRRTLNKDDISHYGKVIRKHYIGVFVQYLTQYFYKTASFYKWFLVISRSDIFKRKFYKYKIYLCF